MTALPPHLQVGREAEEAACQHLQAAGYRILLRNVRTRPGELDVVAVDGASLAVVEVRFRASDRYGGGAASIDWRKRRRIIRATQALLQARRDLRRMPVRFDVVEVTGAPGRCDCRLLRGAFSL